MSGPSAVLFTCNLNRIRSPMAAALMRRRYGDRVEVESCGLRAAETVDPFAVAVIDEIGVDISDHEPKDFAAVEGRNFDLVISLTPEAQHRSVELTRQGGTELAYWPVADPALAEGARDQRLEAYRAVRDELDRLIAERFGAPATFGG